MLRPDTANTRPLGPSQLWLYVISAIGGVYIVYILGCGSGRTGAGLARIPHVSVTSQCLQGWNAVRVPPRAQYLRRSEAFCLSSVDKG
jgi:hypothetical protein